MALVRPAVPAAVWAAGARRSIGLRPRISRAARAPQPRARVSDAVFARRVYLDVWGLLPTPEQLQAFLADRAPDKRERLVATLLADTTKYAEHWVSFWNDLLRNEDGSRTSRNTAGRKSITEWLLGALRTNLPYNQFVSEADQSRRRRAIPTASSSA